MPLYSEWVYWVLRPELSKCLDNALVVLPTLHLGASFVIQLGQPHIEFFRCLVGICHEIVDIEVQSRSSFGLLPIQF